MITFSTVSILANSFKSTRKISPLHTSSSPFAPPASLLTLLDLSIEKHSHKLSDQSHARAHRLGLAQDPLIAQKLIISFCKLKRPSDAKLVFDSLWVKSVHICNALLSGYAKNQVFEECLGLFTEMCSGSVLPPADDFTFSGMLKILGEFSEVWLGRVVHCRGLKNGLILDVVVGNSLMSMYSRSGCLDDAYKVFDEMPLRNVSSWNALISGYAKVDLQNNSGYKLWDLVKGMQNSGLNFDAVTVSILLSCCGESDFSHGRELHCYIVKGFDSRSGLDSEVQLECCLIDMYSKAGKICSARTAFDRLKSKNVIAWTAMINGYVRCGVFDEALTLFREMQWRGRMGPNKVSLVTILPTCSSSAGLIGIKQIHGFAVRMELNHELSLCNALIDTYSKCGSLNYATRVFNHECIDKDAISWGSIISGHGLHGQGEDAVLLFNEMLRKGIKPDTTVIIGVLSACNRSGLMHDGIRIYESLVEKYDTNPTVEMCSCVVDMLGRSGQLDRALEFIKTMPVEPGPSIWGALLTASIEQGNFEIQKLAYESLIQIEPDKSSNYILLSNLYAGWKRWDVVAEVRKVMRGRGLRKTPGCSWICLNGVTHSFVVADKSHPCSDSIYNTLDELVATMKLTGNDMDFVLTTDGYGQKFIAHR